MQTVSNVIVSEHKLIIGGEAVPLFIETLEAFEGGFELLVLTLEGVELAHFMCGLLRCSG